MGQLGFLLLFGLPCAIAFGRISIFAIPLAFFMVLGLVCIKDVHKTREINWLKAIWFIITGVISLVSLSRLTFHEIGMNKYWPLGCVLFLAMMFIGKRIRNGRIFTPGEKELKHIWIIVVTILMLIMMVGQIANLPGRGAEAFQRTSEMEYFRGTSFWGQIYNIGAVAVLITLIGSFCFLTGEETRKKRIRNQSMIFLGFYISYLLLLYIFPYDVLQEAKVPFFLLGRSAAVKSGVPLRIEIFVKFILWICLFFALWDSIKYGVQPMIEWYCCKKSKIQKCGIFLLLIVMIVSLTGCGEEPVKKDFLIVADGNVLLHLKKYEEQHHQKTELSHLKVLVLNENDNLLRIAREIVKYSNVSLQTSVVFSKDDIVKKVGSKKEKLSEQLRQNDSETKMTLLQLLYSVYENQEIRIPSVTLIDDKIKENGTAVIRDGKIWEG